MRRLYIKELSKLSGVSERTLRYYDEIGLLSPARVHTNGYREYDDENLNLLQQILFYRELGFHLTEIKEMVHAKDYDMKQALREQHKLLQQKRDYLDGLIATVDQTINAMEEGIKMTNEQKFDVFKQQMIDENERQYGKEIREQHGEQSVMASYGKLKEMTEEQFGAATQLEQMLFERLQEAMEIGDATNDLALEVAELHKRWLSFYWPKYTKAAHSGLAHMYVVDERFTKYYDTRVGAGATQFLHDSIQQFTQQ